MSKIQFETSGRSMRWYEWVLMLMMLGLVAGVRAQAVYKCTDVQGAIAYQAQACPSSQQETEIAIAPAPAHAASPDYAIVKAQPARYAPAGHAGRGIARDTRISYECRVAGGEVFYRHSPCPHSVPGDATGTGKSRGQSKSLTVSARKVPREEACVQIQRAGAIGRTWRARDEVVSTYDRNLGRDPCN
jgi:hypothetical protein